MAVIDNVAAGTQSSTHFVPGGAIITVTPSPGATATVMYTTQDRVAVQNSNATWLPWPKGAVTATASDLAARSMRFRVQASGGTVQVSTNTNPTSTDLSAYLADFGGSAKYYTNASGQIVGLGAPGGGSVSLGAPVTITGGTNVGDVLTAAPSQGWAVTGGQWDIDGTAAGTGLTITRSSAAIGKAYGFTPTGIPFRAVSAGTAAGAGLTPYLGQVATGTFAFSDGANSECIGSRTVHYARDDISAISFSYGHWRVQTGNETNGAGNLQYTACVEYPAGTKTQFTFGGNRTGTCSAGATLIADMLPINIPNGAKFWIWSRIVGDSNNINYFNGYYGDGTAQMTTGTAASIADNTLTGSTGTYNVVGGSGNGVYSGPQAIIGITTKKSVYIGGDSKSVGATDSYNGSIGQGHLGRAFAPVAACAQLGRFGDQVQSFNGSNAKRIDLLKYFTHVAVDFGINDITSGKSAAAHQADFNTYLSKFGSKPIAVCTLSPVSTGTFTSAAGQTTVASNSVRVAVNTQRLTNLPLAKVIYDVNLTVENTASPEDGLWKAPGGVAYTGDGTHYNQAGAVATAGAIDPQLLLAQ